MPQKGSVYSQFLCFSGAEGYLVLAVLCVSWEDKAVPSYEVQVFKISFSNYDTGYLNTITPFS